MSVHPDLLTYAETVDRDFPLILAIGREPNSDQPQGHGLGTYDFDEFPACAFWNSSYALVSRLSGLQPNELKARCREARASLLAYADCSAVPQPNGAANKSRVRASVSPEDAERHIAGIFSHAAVIDRVALVILSGVDGPEFDLPRGLVEQECVSRRIPSIRVPLFTGSNARKIDAALSPAAEQRIAGLYRGFERAIVAAARPVEAD